MATQQEFEKFEAEYKTVENSLPELVKTHGKIPNVGKLITDYYVNLSVWMQVVVDEVDSVEEIDAQELENISEELVYLRESVIPKYKEAIQITTEFKEMIKSREV